MAIIIKAKRPFDQTTEYEVEDQDPSMLGHSATIGSRIVDRTSGLLWIKNGVLDTDWADPSAGKEKVIFTRFDHNGIDGNYSYVGIGSNSDFETSLAFPDALIEIIKLELVFYSVGTVTNKAIDIFSSYGGIGENKLANTESDSLTGLNFTTDLHATLDVSSIFSSVNGGDVAGITFDHKNIGTTLRYIGLRLEYR